MTDDRERRIKVDVAGQQHIPLWFMGWLFTIGYVHLASWKTILLGLIIWPYYLGMALR